MVPKDPKIDAYISASAEFAQPILHHLRILVHKYCPETKETMKWSFPHFTYNDSILCGMASFKQHCSFGFWLASVMQDPNKIFQSGTEKEGMGNLGKIASLKDLPTDKVFGAYIKQAMALIDKGVKLQKKEKDPPSPLTIPSFFVKALKANKAAHTHFENFSPSQKKEYVEWIEGAKTEATKEKRMQTAIEWLAEGKIRNWKYAR